MPKNLAGVSVLLLALLVALEGCSPQIKPEKDCHFVQNSQLQRVAWRKSDLPLKLYVHESVKESHYSAIESAVKKWNQSLSKEIFQIVAFGTSGPAAPQKDGNTVIYSMNTWESDRQTEQARTTIYWSNSNIYEADIRLNDKNFNFAGLSDDLNFRTVDMESLVVHELGHVLGLAHITTKDSVMQVSLSSGKERRIPGTVDVTALSCEY